MDGGFIAERGFKKIISLFVEMLDKREWKAQGTWVRCFGEIIFC